MRRLFRSWTLLSSSLRLEDESGGGVLRCSRSTLSWRGETGVTGQLLSVRAVCGDDAVKVLLLPLVVSLSGAQPQTIQRQGHDHTIYTIQGSADQLAKFEKEVGSQWKGGLLIDKENGVYRYWAFAERTAPQAREFMFASIMSGLNLDIDAYEEQRFFPSERSELDAIATRCGFKIDPFFVTPRRELRLTPQPGDSVTSVDCALSGITASNTLRHLPMGGFVSNVTPSEKVK